jgi:hypothetical protein
MSQFKRSDDGSEQWFDQLAKQRINERVQQRQGNNQKVNQKSYLDRKVTTVQQPQQEEIHDPFIKNLVESRQNQPFYGPAHLQGQVMDRTLAGNYEVDINMDALQQAILRKQSEFQQQSGMMPTNVGEADLDRIFNKQPQQAPLPGVRQPEPQQQVGGGNQTVTLNTGYPVYRAIHQPNGGGFVLAREVGVVNEQLASQPYISRGTKNVYVVPQHQTQINIQEIQNNPRLLTTLVEVHAPPMASLGPLLVPAQAIVGAYMGGSRQLITDSRQHQYVPQQQQTTQFGFPVKRGILKG